MNSWKWNMNLFFSRKIQFESAPRKVCIARNVLDSLNKNGWFTDNSIEFCMDALMLESQAGIQDRASVLSNCVSQRFAKPFKQDVYEKDVEALIDKNEGLNDSLEDANLYLRCQKLAKFKIENHLILMPYSVWYV